MYVNPAFKTDDDDAWTYVVDRGFGAVVTQSSGLLAATHVPLLVVDEGPSKRIEFHVARPNALHEVIVADPRVLVIVSGPDAYISPDWYASADQVPTWNYRASHITGLARPMSADRTLDHVERLSLSFERRLAPKKPWSTVKMTDKKREAMLRAIVAIEVEVEHIQASTKLGQNKSQADRMEAARMLGWRGGWNEVAMAEIMRNSLMPAATKSGEGR